MSFIRGMKDKIRRRRNKNVLHKGDEGQNQARKE
jgi:hypothetical protein